VTAEALRVPRGPLLEGRTFAQPHSAAIRFNAAHRLTFDFERPHFCGQRRRFHAAILDRTVKHRLMPILLRCGTDGTVLS